MRTEEKFACAYKEAKWYVNHHKKPVWLVPTETNYAVSIIKPLSRDLPTGTTAVLYDTEMNIIDRVENNSELF